MCRSGRIALVKKIAGVSSSDDRLGSYPLGPTQFLKIAEALKTEIEKGGWDYFLEPFEESRLPPEHRRRLARYAH
jgi:hypothetical protein